MKKQTSFTATYNVTNKVQRNLKIVTEIVATLTVTGIAYEDPQASRLDVDNRYALDIDTVTKDGVNIKDVLEVAGMMDEIHDHCLALVPNFFPEYMPARRGVEALANDDYFMFTREGIFDLNEQLVQAYRA